MEYFLHLFHDPPLRRRPLSFSPWFIGADFLASLFFALEGYFPPMTGIVATLHFLLGVSTKSPRYLKFWPCSRILIELRRLALVFFVALFTRFLLKLLSYSFTPCQLCLLSSYVYSIGTSRLNLYWNWHRYRPTLLKNAPT